VRVASSRGCALAAGLLCTPIMLSQDVIVQRPRPVAAMVLVTAVAIGGGWFVREVAIPYVWGPPYEETMTGGAVLELAYKAYPQWRLEHRGQSCPRSFDELVAYTHWPEEDWWGRPYVLICRDIGIAVVSVGEDGKLGTEDDIRSDRLGDD
jgi:hypothetical protein